MFSGSQHNKRVISDIRPAGGTKKSPVLVQKKREIDLPPPRTDRPDSLPPRQHKEGRPSARFGARKIFIVLAALLVVIFSVWWSSSLTVVLRKNLRDFNLGAGVSIVVPAKEFKTEIVERGEGISTNVEAFSKKASGTVVVYNNYSSEPQILVDRTRFQTPAGLTFRLRGRVVVPGKKGEKPGSVDVVVIADEPGEKYNVGFSDFKIPGFAGTPKYDKFYARSRSDEAGNIQGGAAGQGKVVGKAEADALIKELEAKVKANLEAKLTSEVQSPFIVFPDTIETSVTLRVTDPPIGAPGDKFFGEVRGEAKVLAVDRAAYEKALADILFEDKAVIPTYRLPSDAKLICDKPKLDYAAATISCAASGRVIYEGIIPVDELRQKILTVKGVNDLDALYKQYPVIKNVEQTFRPAFLKRIPSRSGQLIIEVR